MGLVGTLQRNLSAQHQDSESNGDTCKSQGTLSVGAMVLWEFGLDFCIATWCLADTWSLCRLGLGLPTDVSSNRIGKCHVCMSQCTAYSRPSSLRRNGESSQSSDLQGSTTGAVSLSRTAQELTSVT